MRVHRLISILLLIESQGMIKAREIADKLEISLRTVYRDIDSLCEAGIPLATTPGPNGGIYLMEGYSGGIDYLQEEEIINIYINSIGIIPDKQSDMAMKLNNALMKLQKRLPPNQVSELNKVKKRFHFDDTLWWGESHGLKYIDIIIYAVLQSKRLEITYTKYNGVTSTRRIHPYGIVVKRMDWYLIGYCEKNKNIRTFKCERIIDSKVLNESFELPDDFVIEEYWRDSESMFKNSCVQKEKYPVVIKLEKNKGHLLEELEVLEINVDKDYIIATINMYKYQFAVDDIMKIVRYVEIIRPIELRTFVESELNRILMKYKDL
ncbi:WYL domain-containing protein [Clostridium sp. YIM B02505]|uniref:WYL domain-containing protein n=1 Tax=Clostridium yunnanense TaxID=2800325 RepID=A0ABS1EUT9_9CLOT|nr:WYL domain-containing protein [Clostridium yunnanense]MBK1813151.1 WYL domain-containing protein [Clostridium yunnanense]